MAFVYFNPNPKNQRVGDCAVRAICKALGKEWDSVYISLCSEGLIFRDMPSANYVWGMFLKKNGFEEYMLPSICPQCTTIAQFAKDHKKGKYVLACQNHVVCVMDGNYYDTWDSGEEIVLYYYKEM